MWLHRYRDKTRPSFWYFENSKGIINDLKAAVKSTDNRNDIKAQIEKIDAELEVTAELVLQHLNSGQETDTLSDKYSKLEKSREKLQKQLDDLELNLIKVEKIINLIETNKNLPVQFDERLWTATVDKVKVYHDRLEFAFFDGIKIIEEYY